MNVTDQLPLRVPIERFPTQSAVAYWVIVGVVYGSLILGSVGPSPVLLWPLLVLLLVLPARGLLKLPERHLRMVDPQATAVLTAEGIVPRLQSVIDEVARAVGCRYRVNLVISAHPTIRAFGSWRRHYMMLDEKAARQLDADWQNPAERPLARTLLRHEIAHFRHHDVQRIGFTRLLLRSTFVVLAWAALTLAAWLLAASLAAPALLEFDPAGVPGVEPIVVDFYQMMFPPLRARLEARMQETGPISIGYVVSYLFTAFVPLVLIGGGLWLVFWRHMLRMQEFYADALAVHHSADPGLLGEALGHYTDAFKRVPAAVSGEATDAAADRRRRWVWEPAWPSFGFAPSPQQADGNPGWLRRLASSHPLSNERLLVADDPLLLYRRWLPVAVAAFVLTMALELILVSPLAGYHLGDFPILFLTITVVLLATSWLLPLLVNGEPYRSGLVKLLLFVLGARVLWIAFNLVLWVGMAVVAPEQLNAALNTYIIGLSRYAGPALSELPYEGLEALIALLPAYFALQLFAAAAIVIGVGLYVALTGRALRRRDPQQIDWQRQHWWTLWLLGFACAMLVIGPGTALLYGSDASLLGTWRVVGYVAGLGALGLLVWREPWELKR